MLMIDGSNDAFWPKEVYVPLGYSDANKIIEGVYKPQNR